MRSFDIFLQFAFPIVLLLLPATLSAQVLPISNSRMQTPSPVIHNKASMPTGWNLEAGDAADVRAWKSPGANAIAIGTGAVVSKTIDVAAMAEKVASQDADWRLILAVDVSGKVGKKGKSEIQLAIREPSTSQVMSSRKFSVRHTAAITSIARPSVSASSFKAGGGKVEYAFDSDPNTLWHSNYGRDRAKYPHHLTLDFGESKMLKGVTYVPRTNGGNGTVKAAAVEVSKDGENWQRMIEGQFSYATPNESQKITLKKPVRCRAVRLVCLSSANGADFASCAEFIPDVEGGFDGLDVVDDTEPPAPIERYFLPLALDAGLPPKVDIGLSVVGNQPVVFNQVHLMCIPRITTKKMLGKPNGHLGPDLLGAGSFGFEGQMVHELPVLPIINVLPNSPAARAKLRNTDLIVGIEDTYLPPGNVAPGFEWFESSHEALLGRSAMRSFAGNGNSKGKVILKILRDDKIVDVKIELALPKEIGQADFLTKKSSLEILNKDLIQRVIATQKKDGSWSNGPIQTSLGGLALLSTGDKQYGEQINSAANWLMSKNAEPGPGWYWHPSFSGIFLCEYYLATGDQRALPVIRRMLRMMGSTFHTSKWDTKTFGHGPKGLPYGNKSLVAVMVHVLVFEQLAQRCGLESEILETLTPYLESAWSDPSKDGHGAMGYNASHKDLDEFWSRTGLFGLVLKMGDLRPDMQKPMAEIMRKRHPWFRNSHAYGEPGGVLGLIGLSQLNRDYFDEVFEQYRWWFALAWESGHGLHFTIPHMGAPYMEGRDLINNGYAIVTNIQKSNLQILGGNQRDWLDVSEFEQPISDVMILQAANDQVSLRCRIPGPEIYYTLDGADPDQESTKFTEPFTVQPGTVVRAMASNESGQSKISERRFGYKKSNWKVVSASGDKDPGRAIERASFVIDGDHRIGWVPDQGEGSTGFPHQFVVDMGQSQIVKQAEIRFVFDQGAASQITILGSNKSDKDFVAVGERTLEKFDSESEVELDGSNIRFLKFVFDKPFQEESNLLMVGEIDVR